MAAPVAQLELRLAQCRERLTALRGRRAGHADAAERLKGAEAQEAAGVAFGARDGRDGRNGAEWGLVLKGWVFGQFFCFFPEKWGEQE